VKRRLAAIMAADAVGYSRLMREDEPGALALLNKHRPEVIDPAIVKHRGRTVKLMGDGAGGILQHRRKRRLRRRNPARHGGAQRRPAGPAPDGVSYRRTSRRRDRRGR
jgi:hypothetical protein